MRKLIPDAPEGQAVSRGGVYAVGKFSPAISRRSCGQRALPPLRPAKPARGRRAFSYSRITRSAFVFRISPGKGVSGTDDFSFSVFPNENFLDLRLYQYGYEQCAPLHSLGPFVKLSKP